MRASESAYAGIDSDVSESSLSAARFFEAFLLDVFFFDALLLVGALAERFLLAAGGLRARLLACLSETTCGAASSSSSLIRWKLTLPIVWDATSSTKVERWASRGGRSSRIGSSVSPSTTRSNESVPNPAERSEPT